LAGLVLLIIFGPQLWAKRTFSKYNRRLEHLPGSGGELARHLLDRFHLTEVKVETTDQGDHYDPTTKTVRLTQNVFQGQSLTAVAIAAHEVGHAIQDRDGHPMLKLRTRLVGFAKRSEQIGSLIILSAPIVTTISRAPGIGILMFVAGVGTIFLQTLVHLITLPVEWDASFGKALPILKEGYISEKEQAAAEKILKAAAFTYVAGSLGSLLNLWRWIRVLRPR